MNTQYTNNQLKQALAKMLPEVVEFNDNELEWKNTLTNRFILNTELLHLCWLVEEELSIELMYNYISLLYKVNNRPRYNYHNDCHATWQHRTIALIKVMEIEIV